MKYADRLALVAVATACLVRAGSEMGTAQVERHTVWMPGLANGPAIWAVVPTADAPTTPRASEPTADASPTRTPTVTRTSRPAPTRRPTRTQTPTAEPTPTATDGPSPTITPQPTATAAPTNTPADGVACRDYVQNGGFEDGLAHWTVAGSGVDILGIERDPFRGEHFLRMEAEAGGDILAVKSEPFVPPPPDKIQSATVKFWHRGQTLERQAEGDELKLWIRHPSPARCEFCIRTVVVLHNDDITGNWRGVEFDATEALRRGWSEVQLDFQAESDFLDYTRWHVDGVTVEICARP